MKKIDLTFITIVYRDNVACLKTVNSVCDSILKYPEYIFEHIIIDGGSDANLREDIELLRRLNIKLVSEPDNGIYDAMNKGVRIASGDYVNFLNAGDSLNNDIDWNSIFALLKGIKHNNAIAGLALSSKIIFPFYTLDIYARTFDPRFPRMPTVHQSMIYKRDVIRNESYLSKYTICGDFENYLRIVLSGKLFVPVDQYFSLFYAGGKSSMHPFKLFCESFKISSMYIDNSFIQRAIIIMKLFISLLAFQTIFHFNRFLKLFIKSTKAN